jgi:hypothetical protein
LDKKDRISKLNVNMKDRKRNSSKLFYFGIILFIIILTTVVSAVAYYNMNQNDEIPIINDSNNVSSNNPIITENITDEKMSNNDSRIKEGYSLLEIHGLKCYIETKYTDFLKVDDNTDYDGMDGYFELTKGKTVDFVDYSDFAQLIDRSGTFSIEITTGKDVLKPVDNFEDYPYKNLTILNHNVKVIHLKNYVSQNFDGERTFAFFKVDEKYVAISWSGYKVDEYVIESFFRLN